MHVGIRVIPTLSTDRTLHKLDQAPFEMKGLVRITGHCWNRSSHFLTSAKHMAAAIVCSGTYLDILPVVDHISQTVYKF